MGGRYWSDSDAQWPEGQDFDERTGRFPGMSAALRPLGGVSRVPTLRNDGRVLDDVCRRYAHSNAVDPSEVTVEVRDGRVSLEGSVPQRAMRYALETSPRNAWASSRSTIAFALPATTDPLLRRTVIS